MTVVPIRPAVTLGGSTAAAAAGIDPYRSRVMLWCELTGRVERVENEAMRWGTALQPVILEELLERGYALERPVHDDYRDRERPWLVGHPDHFAVPPDGSLGDPMAREVVEVKTASVWAHRVNGGVPVAYAAQCQVYMHLTGLDRALLACLVGGQRLELRELDRDQHAIDTLLSLMADFMGYVDRDEPPPPDGSESARDALAALWPAQTPGAVMRADRNLRAVVQDLRLIRESEQALKEQRTARENIIKEAMRDRETLIDHRDEPLVTWKQVTSNRLNTKLLKDHLPDVYEQYTDEQTTRRFEVK